MNIYISNLGFNVDSSGLKDLFADYGPVASANVIKDKISGQSRGFGFVEINDDAAARKSIEELNGTMVDGRSIKVTEARPRENR